MSEDAELGAELPPATERNPQPPESRTGAYQLGCPIFSNPKWVGNFLPKGTRQRDFLRTYSETFTTVEGNSTFYGLPNRATVERWIDQTAEDFRFALKFPRAISHEYRLRGSSEHPRAFLRLLDMLDKSDRLGPSFLQLPPNFSTEYLDDLVRFLKRLPGHFPFAVEVRHPDWFGESDASRSLNDTLEQLGMDRVILDSRPLFSRPPETQEEVRASGRKPNVPAEFHVTGQHPFVRLIGRDDVPVLEAWVEDWTVRIAEWIKDGKTPYVFAHTPDDTFAPQLAKLFHSKMKVAMPELPNLRWPKTPQSTDADEQLSLF